MIIFGGTKVKQTVLDSGHFLCPACGSEQRYLHKSVQKKAHVYFISLASIGDALEYVECQTCKSTWHPQVLNVRTDPSFGAAEDALLDIVAWTIVADDKVNDSERKVAAEQYQKIVGTRIDEAELQARIDSVFQTGIERVQSLAGHGRTLDLGTRIMLFKAALFVAAADDDLKLEELQVVVNFDSLSPSLIITDRAGELILISNALGLSKAQVKATMEEMIAASNLRPMLSDFQAGVYTSQEQAITPSIASDLRMTLGVVVYVVFLVKRCWRYLLSWWSTASTRLR